MTARARRGRPKKAAPAQEIEALYHRLLSAFYRREDLPRARQLGRKLEAALAADPAAAESIRGEEVRALLAELRGDLAEAIRCRESEIRQILMLHNRAIGTPAWEYVSRRYDHSDVSDRLDLLASLYADQGDVERARRTLNESRRYCESHQIPFDGQDLQDEIEQARSAG